MITTLALLQVLASTSLSWSPPPGWLVAGPLARSVLVPLLLMAATRLSLLLLEPSELQ